MRYSIVSVVLAVLLLTPGFGSGIAAAGTARTTAPDVMGELRSVTCEGERLEDCKSDPSAQLREYVKGRVAAGWSKQRILKQVAQTYGGHIMLAPPKRGFSLWLWAAPFVAVAAAAVFIYKRSAAWAKQSVSAVEPTVTSGNSQLADAYAARVAEELKDY